ncbi:MAG: hypothetical protein ACWA5U_07575, partial [bacterium]
MMILIRVILIGVFILSFQVNAEVSSNSYPKVRIIYIVPSDKSYKAEYEENIRKAIMNLQDFYLAEMGNGKTFFVNSPVVEVLKSRYSSLIFSESMWTTAIDETILHFNAMWNDPENRWLLFVDSDVACDGEGIGGTNGFAVMGANDLRGLSNEEQIYNCEKDKNVPQYNTPARWVGGLGHELGHSWLLPHPDGCEPQITSECPKEALMFLGYANYPDTFLLSTYPKVIENLLPKPLSV